MVISTVSGAPQINLIDAAANSGVRRFVPAEFEGAPGHRPRHARHDPLDRGKAASLERLRHWANQRRCVMKFTIFTCGVFYERFAHGGLAAVGVGASTGYNHQGAYLLDIENRTAEIVARTSSSGRDIPIYISLVSLNDVGRFVAAAIEHDPMAWPGELRMAGERRSLSEIVQWAESIKGGSSILLVFIFRKYELTHQGTLFTTDVIQAGDLQAHIEHADFYQQYDKLNRMHELQATEKGRYDFENPNLNALVDVEPTSFWDWLRLQYGIV